MPAFWIISAVLTVFAAPLNAQPVAQEPAPTTEQDILEHIAILASDDFAGRDPGTIGETKTLRYLAEQWAATGMVSGTNDADSPWYQPVPLIERKPIETNARFLRNGRAINVDDDDIFLNADRPEAKVSGPVIFVGYGTDASNTVKADVDGKIALMLYESPRDAEDYPSRDQRREALTKAGAVAVLTVAPDGFPWRAVRRRARRGSYERNAYDRPTINGIIRPGLARDLFRRTESNLEAESKAAENSSVYAGFDMGLTANLSASMEVRSFTSHNIIGKFPGSKPGSGAVMLLGHWDHFGSECRPLEEGDRICNGAQDNASGLAVLTEIAEELGRLGPFDRDIYFMGTTAEERGLLGAFHYADNPVFPLEDIVIALNIDTATIAKRGAPVAIIGRGETDLDDEIDAISRSLGREVEKSLEPNAYIRRLDSWALAAKGVPALMIGGAFADEDLLQKFLRGIYHTPDDEMENIADLSGAAEDTDLHIALVRHFADTEKYSKE